MSVLLCLILAAAIAWLWRRVDRLERELARLSHELTVPAPAASVAPDEAFVPPARAELVPPADPLPPATAAAEAPAPEPPERGSRLDLEDLFGRRLPIWAGGITLAVAGFFLVRWSIDAGLLTPPVRVALAGLFGAALIGAAEAAYRWRERVADPRVAQALAGAGLATLYAAFYLAGSAYGLIGSSFAFVGLAAVTATAIGLSYRFGLPSAVLGLVGGFAAPALVGSDQANVPLLTLYLALVTAGLAWTGRRQDRAWLGMAALAGGLGWGALLIAGGAAGRGHGAVLGAYLVLLGAVVPVLAGAGGSGSGSAGRGAGTGRPHWIVRVAAASLAAGQLAVLVQQGGFGALEWGLYLLLGVALAWFGWRQPAMREANAVAATVGAALVFTWGAPAPLALVAVSAAVAAIFAGVPLAQLARGHGRALDVAQAAGVALALAAAALWHFGGPLPATPQPRLALALLILASLPLAALALARRSPGAQRSWLQTAVQALAALLVFLALAQVVAPDALAWTAAVAAVALAWRARSWVGAAAMLALLAAGWAAVPLVFWLWAGSRALIGIPLAAAELPAARDVALHLLPTAVALGAWSFAGAPGSAMRRWTAMLGIALAAVAAHVLFRHAVAALAGDDLVRTGVLARAAWQALLLAAAWLLWRRSWRTVAIALAGVALAHFGWFSLALHNPLWSRQAVGSLPVANALLPAYAAGLAALAALRRWLADEQPYLRWGLDGLTMAVIALFALSALRQAFAGSLLTAVPIGATEDLLRSLAGIVLAMAFLWWGVRRQQRSWRIGSLVLMVIAVLKVFLIDAAGLEGLARIASFMALGFSLIGIGWFYARQLRARAPG